MKRSAAAVMLLALCLTLCACRGKDAAMTVGDSKIEQAEYVFYLNYNRLKLFGECDSYTNAQLQSARQAAIVQIVTAQTVREKCRELGIEPDDRQLAQAGSEKADLTASLGGKKGFEKYLKTSCLTERTYDKLSQNDLYYSLLLDHYTRQNEAKYTTEYLQDYYADNYIWLKYIRLSLHTDTGERVSAKEEQKISELADTVAQKAKNGSDFDELIWSYSDDSGVAGGSEGVIISRRAGESQAYVQAAFELKNGETSGVITQSDGLYIVKRLNAPLKYLEPNLDSVKKTAAESDFALQLAEWTAQAQVELKKSVDKITFGNMHKYVK